MKLIAWTAFFKIHISWYLSTPADIVQKGFVGCLKDVYFMKNYSPSAIWEPLVWQNSEEQINVYDSWEGCPTSLQEGAQFLGAGKVWK